MILEHIHLYHQQNAYLVQSDIIVKKDSQNHYQHSLDVLIQIQVVSIIANIAVLLEVIVHKHQFNPYNVLKELIVMILIWHFLKTVPMEHTIRKLGAHLLIHVRSVKLGLIALKMQ